MKRQNPFILIPLLFALTSCNNLFAPSTGNIEVSLPAGKNRTRAAASSQDVSLYVLKLYKSGTENSDEPVSVVNAAAGTSASIANISEGTYTLKVYAYTDASSTLSTGYGVTENISVIPGQITNAAVSIHTTVSTFAELSTAVTNGGTYTITENIKATSYLEVKAATTLISTSKAVTITRDSSFTEALFTVDDGISFTIQGSAEYPITIDGGSTTTVVDPLINSSGTLNVSNAVLTNNNTGSAGNAQGAGIYVSNGTTTITSSTISNCTAYMGGAIFIYAGTLNIDSITLNGNSADYGKDLYLYNGTTTLIQGTITGSSLTSSVMDLYFNNSFNTPVLTPGTITLANGTAINVTIASIKESMTLLTKSSDDTDGSILSSATSKFALADTTYIISATGTVTTK